MTAAQFTTALKAAAGGDVLLWFTGNMAFTRDCGSHKGVQVDECADAVWAAYEAGLGTPHLKAAAEGCEYLFVVAA